ncbi:MAG TPA: chromosomal replication initiator protein DnaA [Candidatus Paceibacterota bacterium]
MDVYTETNRAQLVGATPKQLWENVLVDVELSISKANFSTWFKDTAIVKQEEGVIFVGVPNQFVKDWLSTKYHKFILKTLRSFSDSVRGLEYVIVRDRQKQQSEMPRIIQSAAELPLELYINKNDNLNPRYTFDTFVVGPFNNLAYAAAQAIIQKPGIAYNPFFIYGGTGRGKTHLMQAIGNHIKKNSPSKKVYYMTSEKFANDYLNSVQDMQKMKQFKERYRQYDVFIMDDVQFFSKTEKTQEELFHLFNALYDNNKQIIFSSDKHPSYIQNIDERLKSRFAAGMVTDIGEPDYESRVTILQSKASHNNFVLEKDIAQYLAENIQGNVRELEGVLNSIICQTQLKGKTLDLLEVKNLIKDTSRPKKLISAKEVIKKVADFYEIEEASIYEKTRRKEVVRPRQIIMYILREDFHVSYPTIGQKLGGRDHTTVIHSCEKMRNELKQDTNLLEELDQLRALLK